jgi:DNA (cytosine-5)-methyltransferase 1
MRDPSKAASTGGRSVAAGCRPIAIDLFSGVGGLSLGFEQAGFDIVTAVEYDPVHAAVHEFNFPVVPIVCADVNKLAPAELETSALAGLKRLGRDPGELDLGIDVVFGGPPCQGFSFIGYRALDDPRNSLVFRFFEIVRALRPKYFVMENVPGMRAGGHASILADLVDCFEGAGYEIVRPIKVLNAADFGVPQDRKRLILLGYRKGEKPPAYPAPSVNAKRRRWRSEPPSLFQFLPPGPTVSDAIGDLPDLDGYPELIDSDSVALSREVLAQMSRRASRYARRLRGSEDDPNDRGYPREWDLKVLTSSLRTLHTSESKRRFRRTQQGCVEPISRFLRLDPEGLCNTLRAGSGSERGAFTSPRPIHPHLPRVISVREAARLHGFPDWFRMHVTKWNGFRSVGNAVPPPLARAIAWEVVGALGADPPRPVEPLKLGDPSLLRLNRLEAAAHFEARISDIPASRRRLVESA